ncbi:AraC family transcriptional regulator [Bradyrhizobium japonicum]|nr:AraC family transcriptional regulator [Bradyrhizobium japonicum]WLB59175.1 AraC family transcriptional regulator [Bradyrhizobium japonicum]WLB68111.1 AraC family transcriptional regulator [Bradyrhizobium japonicum]
MNKHILRDSLKDASVAPEACQVTPAQVTPASAERPHAGAEIARVLGTTAFRMALDTSGAAIAHRKYERVHDVCGPAHPDPVTSQLLLTAADVLEGNEAPDTLFRHQLPSLLAARRLAPHTGSPTTIRPTMGGLSPKVLSRAIERLRPDNDADVSLAALASDAGLSRFHFCRAFKKSTGLSPHAWLRQRRLDEAKNMLCDTDAPVISVAVALGYSSQTAFAAAFRKLTGETPSSWRRRVR